MTDDELVALAREWDDAGRKTLVSQAADPLSDRKTTIEVTITVVK